MIVTCCVLVPHVRAQPSGSPWQFNHPANLDLCQVAGQTREGRILLTVPGRRADVVSLVLQKPSWRIPSGTPVSVTMSFSDGTTVPLAGLGKGTDIEFDLTGYLLKPWLHGLTAGTTGSIVFSAGNEPAWPVSLRGTSPAVSAMYDCVQTGNLPAPAPLGTPTQPAPASQPFDAQAARLQPPSPAGNPGAFTVRSAQEPVAVPSSTGSLAVMLEADVMQGLMPYVLGRTNLPTGTKLQVSLKASYPACYPRCGYTWPLTTVVNGTFRAGPFSTSTTRMGTDGPPQDLDPGRYTIIITSFIDSFKAASVSSIVGQNGERMSGPTVLTGPITTPTVLYEGTKGIYYTREVSVGR